MIVRHTIMVGLRDRVANAKRRRHLLGIMAVDLTHRPVVGGDTLHDVVGDGERGVAVDRNIVLVVQNRELRQTQMTGEAERLVADALHQVAVRADDPGAVIDQRFAEPRREDALGERHADRGRQALAERACRGLDRRVLAKFGMAGGGGVQLPKRLQLIDAHSGMAGQVQQRIEQHRAMTGGEHEPVAIGPMRRAGIEFVKPRP